MSVRLCIDRNSHDGYREKVEYAFVYVVFTRWLREEEGGATSCLYVVN